MPEQIIYIRGGIQHPIFERPSQDQGLMEALKSLLEISDEQINRLSQNLINAPGFLDPKALLVKIREVIPENKLSQAIRRFLLQIGPSGIKQIILGLEEEQKEENPPFEAEVFSRLKRIANELVQCFPAISKYQKADRLSKITGQQLEAIELISDIRPIFDETRKNIDGMMPYTRMHIVATGADGLPKSFEAELTYQQVIELAEKVEKAKTKIDVLRQSIESWVPGSLPDIPLTRIYRKDSNDAKSDS